MRVYMRHIRAAGYCSRGCRLFAQRYGIDWPRFLREGIEADTLRQTRDAMTERVIREADREQG
jgi:hypothetical protein